MKTAVRAIVGVVIVMLVGVSVVPGTLAADAEAATAGAPLPVGDELSNEELLGAEGELWWLVVPVLVHVAIAGGISAIQQNWFDEEYGIDRDDRREIFFQAIGGAMQGAAGVLGAAHVR